METFRMKKSAKVKIVLSTMKTKDAAKDFV